MSRACFLESPPRGSKRSFLPPELARYFPAPFPAQVAGQCGKNREAECKNLKWPHLRWPPTHLTMSVIQEPTTSTSKVSSAMICWRGRRLLTRVFKTHKTEAKAWQTVWGQSGEPFKTTLTEQVYLSSALAPAPKQIWGKKRGVEREGFLADGVGRNPVFFAGAQLRGCLWKVSTAGPASVRGSPVESIMNSIPVV